MSTAPPPPCPPNPNPFCHLGRSLRGRGCRLFWTRQAAVSWRVARRGGTARSYH